MSNQGWALKTIIFILNCCHPDSHKNPQRLAWATSPQAFSPLPSHQSITRLFELVQSLLGHTTWLTKAMGNSSDGAACGLVPFTQMETRHFPTGLPTSPHEINTMQDCHNVARTGSMDTHI